MPAGKVVNRKNSGDVNYDLQARHRAYFERTQSPELKKRIPVGSNRTKRKQGRTEPETETHVDLINEFEPMTFLFLLTIIIFLFMVSGSWCRYKSKISLLNSIFLDIYFFSTSIRRAP